MEYKEEQLAKIREMELGLYHKLSEICKKYNLTFVTGFGTTLGAIRHKGFIPWDDDMDFLMPRKDYEKLIKLAPKELTGTDMELLEPRLTDGYVMTFAKLTRKDSTFVEETDLHFTYHCGVYIDIFPMDYWPADKKKRNKLAFHCYCLNKAMVLATYPKPKMPPGLKGIKRKCAEAGCRLAHSFLRLFRLSTGKLYKKYRSLAARTSPKKAEDYVTDMTWCWIRKLPDKVREEYREKELRGINSRYEMFGLQYRYNDLFDTVEVPFEDTTIPVPKEFDSYLTLAYKDYMTWPPVEKRHSHVPKILELPE